MKRAITHWSTSGTAQETVVAKLKMSWLTESAVASRTAYKGLQISVALTQIVIFCALRRCAHWRLELPPSAKDAIDTAPNTSIVARTK